VIAAHRPVHLAQYFIRRIGLKRYTRSTNFRTCFYAPYQTVIDFLLHNTNLSIDVTIWLGLRRMHGKWSLGPKLFSMIRRKEARILVLVLPFSSRRHQGVFYF
jgi:hypothetical protein